MDERIRDLEAVDAATYDSVDLDRLVMYTAVKLSSLGIDLSRENIVVGAFRLFPSKFSLVGYPQFPDATRVEKALWRCKGRNRQWIAGKTQHGYRITDRTRAIAAQAQHQLSNPQLSRRKTTPRRRKERILEEVASSPAYSKYLSGKENSVSESDLCYLLQGTLDSSPETLRKNLASLKVFTEELEREDVSTFLQWLESRFGHFLNSGPR